MINYFLLMLLLFCKNSVAMNTGTIQKITTERLVGFEVIVHGTMQQKTDIKNITDLQTLRSQLVVDYFFDLINAYKKAQDLDSAYQNALDGKEYTFPDYVELKGTIYYATQRGYPLLLHESWLDKEISIQK